MASRFCSVVVAWLVCASTAHAVPSFSDRNPFLTTKDCPKLVCDGVKDDGPALNACLAALPNHSALKLTAGKVCRTTVKIQLAQKIGVSFGCDAASTDHCGIRWDGATDVDAVLELDGFHDSRLENLTIVTGGSSNNVARKGIAVLNTGGGGITTTNTIFRNVSIQTNLGVAFTPADYVAADINPAGANNVETFLWDGGVIVCAIGGQAGFGINTSTNSNQKGYHWTNMTVSNCAKGAQLPAGSIYADNLKMQSNTIAFNGSPSDYCVLEAIDGENNGQFYVGGGCSIKNSRIGASHPTTPLATHPIFQLTGSAVVLEGNLVYGQDSGSVIVACNPASQQTNLTFRANTFLPDAVAVEQPIGGILTAARSSCGDVVFDGYIGYGGGILLSGPGSGGYTPGSQPSGLYSLPGTQVAGNYTPGVTNTVVFAYDIGAAGFAQQKVVVSENGRPYREVLPGQNGTDPGCTVAADVGKVWVSNAATTVWKRCHSAAGVIAWVTF